MDREGVIEQLRVAYGSQCQLEKFEPFPGGARKQIYMIGVRNPEARCLMYVWSDSDDGYFADRARAGFEETQTAREAPVLFDANTRFLHEHGVSIPSVIHRGTLNSGDEFAFVEAIEGSHWTSYTATASQADRTEVLRRVAEQVSRLHSITRTSPGIPVDVIRVPVPSVQRTAERTLWELDALADTDEAVMRERARIADRVAQLEAQVSPRTDFTLIHGELPHQIPVRHHDQEVFVIDIEGVRYFDVEVDHVQCKLFLSDDDYQALARADLDPARMNFYTFCWHVSCAYAGSRLVAGGFPDQELARRIYEGNLQKALALA